MKKSLSQYTPIFIICLLLLLAADAPAVSAAVSARLTLCLSTLIPSLFGCMAAANLLLAGGAAAKLGAGLRIPARLLHFSDECMGIFAVSQLAGYPVGALLLKQAADAGRLTGREAAARTAVCYGGGPAFLVGFAGAELFGSTAAGWVMLGACILANFAVAAVCRPPAASGIPAESPPCRLHAAALTASVSDTVRSLVQICGIVLCFGVVTRLAELLGILRLLTAAGRAAGIPAQTVAALFAAVLDVTQLRGLLVCGLPFHLLLPLTAGLLSFGGICVQMQCLSVGVPELSAVRLLLTRLLTALLTTGLTAAAVPFLPVPDAAAVFAHETAVSRSGSVIPALLIFSTGFPLLFPARRRTGAHIL